MLHSWKKNFGIIWGGQFISLITSTAVNFAIIIWLSLETKSAEVLAFAAIAGLLPQALIGPFAGVYIDRWDRRLTMILADAFVAICTLAMSVLFYFGHFELGLIYVILCLRSIGAAFHTPAMQASVPLIVPESELIRVAGLNQINSSIATIAGPALGALAIGLMDIGMVLLLDIGGAIIAIITLLFVKIPQPAKLLERSSVQQTFRDMKLGVRAITGNKELSTLLSISVICTFCTMPLWALFPLMTTQHFLGDKFEMSIIEVSWGIGMLIGGGALGVLKPAINKVWILNTMYLLLGFSLAASGVLSANSFNVFVILTAIGGLAASVYNACLTTMIQQNIAPEMMGRVFSLFLSVSILPGIFGLMSAGFLADEIGLRLTFVMMGIIVLTLGIISFFIPNLYKLDTQASFVSVKNA